MTINRSLALAQLLTKIMKACRGAVRAASEASNPRRARSALGSIVQDYEEAVPVQSPEPSMSALFYVLHLFAHLIDKHFHHHRRPRGLGIR